MLLGHLPTDLFISLFSGWRLVVACWCLGGGVPPPLSRLLCPGSGSSVCVPRMLGDFCFLFGGPPPLALVIVHSLASKPLFILG